MLGKVCGPSFEAWAMPPPLELNRTVQHKQVVDDINTKNPVARKKLSDCALRLQYTANITNA